MQRVAFRMQLKPGFEEEYQRRHELIWPELQKLLKDSGIHEYAIFLDPVTLGLFGSLQVTDISKMDELPSQPVMQKWWAYMKDIMETNEDNSPVSIPLKEVFFLP